jgi:hypothetical protein
LFRLSDVRFMSSKRSANWSTAARRKKTRLSQSSTWGTEEPVLTAGLSSFLGGEEGSKGGQPLLPAPQ